MVVNLDKKWAELSAGRLVDKTDVKKAEQLAAQMADNLAVL